MHAHYVYSVVIVVDRRMQLHAHTCACDADVIGIILSNEVFGDCINTKQI